MATKFSKGDEVKVAAATPSGPIQAFRMDDDGVVSCLIEWTDANGDVQQRWFAEDDLTEV